MLPAIGFTCCDENRALLDDASIDAVQIRFAAAERAFHIENYVRGCGLRAISVHATELALASPEACTRQLIAAIEAFAAANDAQFLSAPLGVPGGDLRCQAGVLPPALTEASLERTCRNIDSIQRLLGARRLFLANLPAPDGAPGPLPEADFLSSILQRTGCGWMLDVAAVFANSRNIGFDPYDFIAEVMPSASRVQMLLSGGRFDARTRRHVCSRSQPIPDEVWSLYRHALVLGGHKTVAAFIVREANPPSSDGWLNEARHARFLVERVSGRQRMLRKRELIRRA
ncbi:MAG: DUF692 family protein [Planctomyces sp.]|nr:DUF692 family protein [Planctomyces sp.]